MRLCAVQLPGSLEKASRKLRRMTGGMASLFQQVAEKVDDIRMDRSGLGGGERQTNH